MEIANRKEELLNNWQEELSEILKSTDISKNKEQQIIYLIEELLDAKEDADYWLHMPR